MSAEWGKRGEEREGKPRASRGGNGGGGERGRQVKGGNEGRPHYVRVETEMKKEERKRD